MKKLFLVVLLGMMFMSCNLENSYYEVDEVTEEQSTEERQDGFLYSLIGNKSELYTDEYIYALENNIDIINYLRNNMEYEIVEVWDDVEDILERGYGDCKDYTRVWMNIVYITTGVKCNLICVKHEARSIANGGSINHAIVEYPDGTQIEPQSGRVVDYTVEYRYTFDEVFNL